MYTQRRSSAALEADAALATAGDAAGSSVSCSDLLCGRLNIDIPSRENQNRRMTTQGSSQNFRALDAQTDAIVFYCRYR